MDVGRDPRTIVDRGVELARSTYARLDDAGDDGLARLRVSTHGGDGSWFNRMTRRVHIGVGELVRSPGSAAALGVLETTAHEASHKWFDTRAGFGGLIYGGPPGRLSEGLAQTMSAVSLVLEGSPAEQAHGWRALDPSGRTATVLGIRRYELPLSTHMDDVRRTPATLNDNGLVHVHRGVIQAAHLQIARSVGMEALGRITVDAARELTPVTGFRRWAEATDRAAGVRFGAASDEQQAVRQAWRAVGVLARAV